MGFGISITFFSAIPSAGGTATSIYTVTSAVSLLTLLPSIITCWRVYKYLPESPRWILWSSANGPSSPRAKCSAFVRAQQSLMDVYGGNCDPVDVSRAVVKMGEDNKRINTFPPTHAQMFPVRRVLFAGLGSVVRCVINSYAQKVSLIVFFKHI